MVKLRLPKRLKLTKKEIKVAEEITEPKILKLTEIERHPLDQLLRSLRLPQWKVSKVLGISSSSLWSYLNGVRKMPEGMEEDIKTIIDNYIKEKNHEYKIVKRNLG